MILYKGNQTSARYELKPSVIISGWKLSTYKEGGVQGLGLYIISSDGLNSSYDPNEWDQLVNYYLNNK